MLVQVVGPPKINVKGLVNTEQFYTGIRDCFSKTYKGSGLRGLYRGVGTSFKTYHAAVNLFLVGFPINM